MAAWADELVEQGGPDAAALPGVLDKDAKLGHALVDDAAARQRDDRALHPTRTAPPPRPPRAVELAAAPRPPRVVGLAVAYADRAGDEGVVHRVA